MFIYKFPNNFQKIAQKFFTAPSVPTKPLFPIFAPGRWTPRGVFTPSLPQINLPITRTFPSILSVWMQNMAPKKAFLENLDKLLTLF